MAKICCLYHRIRHRIIAHTKRRVIPADCITFVSQYASTPEAIKTWRRKIASRMLANSTRFPTNAIAPRPPGPDSAMSHRDELEPSVSWSRRAVLNGVSVSTTLSGGQRFTHLSQAEIAYGVQTCGEGPLSLMPRATLSTRGYAVRLSPLNRDPVSPPPNRIEQGLRNEPRPVFWPVTSGESHSYQNRLAGAQVPLRFSLEVKMKARPQTTRYS